MTHHTKGIPWVERVSSGSYETYLEVLSNLAKKMFTIHNEKALTFKYKTPEHDYDETAYHQHMRESAQRNLHQGNSEDAYSATSLEGADFVMGFSSGLFDVRG